MLAMSPNRRTHVDTVLFDCVRDTLTSVAQAHHARRVLYYHCALFTMAEDLVAIVQLVKPWDIARVSQAGKP